MKRIYGLILCLAAVAAFAVPPKDIRQPQTASGSLETKINGIVDEKLSPLNANFKFENLNDVPSKVGKAGKVFKVKVDGSGYEWADDLVGSGGSGSGASSQDYAARYEGSSVSATTTLELSLVNNADIPKVTLSADESMFFRADIAMSGSDKMSGGTIQGVMSMTASGVVSFVKNPVVIMWDDTNAFDCQASFYQSGILRLIVSGPANLSAKAVVTTSKSGGIFATPLPTTITGQSLTTTTGLVLSYGDPTMAIVSQSNPVLKFSASLSMKSNNSGYAGAQIDGALKMNASGVVSFIESPIATVWSDQAGADPFDVTASYTSDGRLVLIASGPAGLDVRGFLFSSNNSSVAALGSTGAAGTVIDMTPCGGIIMWGSSTVPLNYLACNGQSVSTTEYPDLFNTIGYSYGGSSGTFMLPNFQGVYAKGAGSRTISGVTYSDTLGTSGGDTFQYHVHRVTNDAFDPNSAMGDSPTNQYWGSGYEGIVPAFINPATHYHDHQWYAGLLTQGRSGTVTEPAHVVVNYIIKATKAVGSSNVDLIVNNLTVTGNMTGGSSSSDPSGVVKMFVGANAPSGWMLCQGQTLNRVTYASLFAVIGTTYNDGSEASDSFRIPDFRGVFAQGAGTQSIGGVSYAGTLGAKSQDTLQQHSHETAFASSGLFGTGYGGSFGNGITEGAGEMNAANRLVAGSIFLGRVGSVTKPASVGINYIIKL